jgi:hypothetical protein
MRIATRPPTPRKIAPAMAPRMSAVRRERRGRRMVLVIEVKG